MHLLESTGRISDDRWVHVGDDEGVPTAGDIIVTPGRLPVSAPGRLGIAIANHVDVASLDLDLGSLSLIVLNFPSFADGRAYSQARALRNTLGYVAELRASGHLLPDQLGFMVEVGFDSFDLQTDRFPVERWTEALEAVTLTYHRHLARPGQARVIAARHAG